MESEAMLTLHVAEGALIAALALIAVMLAITAYERWRYGR